jgi:hypothetical protein
MLVVRFAAVAIGIEVLISICTISNAPSEDTIIRPILRIASSVGFYYLNYTQGLFN